MSCECTVGPNVDAFAPTYCTYLQGDEVKLIERYAIENNYYE